MSTVDTQMLRILTAAQTASAGSSPAGKNTQAAAQEAAAPAAAAAAPAVPAAPPPPPAVEETLAAVAKQIESYLKSVGRSLEFRVDDATGRTIVSVRDAETGELIRQIPGEEVLRLAHALGNQPNVLVDLTA